ncbi:DUF4236 domain-containing protein [Acinetobacter haemolyticus]|uniref:DUF4236 domain-containing protein n=1 Tax=Acinetobacter haemolyticus TaxID=29430 RepID=UPI0021CDD780|nr:DUF4236 domain-containing protein [Acinetobacter haemolyticus]MCU4378848.1 DUF4236 domain-containing protein [Acinetobacter haemolyticus]
MGFNFRKSLKIAPGVKLNIGKKGISSVSVGKNGARVSAGKKGVRSTVGIPGSGLSYSKTHNLKGAQSNSLQRDKKSNSIGFGTLLIIGILLLFPIIWIFG